MAYLLYGITKDPVVKVGPMTGVKGREISFVTGHGLCAAVSEISTEDGAPPVAELLVYSRVVEDLHRLQAVVPMRYGCFLNGIPVIRDALKERQRQYQALLEKLEGHVEMGIRLLLSEAETPPPQAVPPVNGRNYLSRQKVHYRMREETSLHHQILLDGTIQAFSGLYDKHRTETATKNGAVILSLYFLVPGNKVNLFRETFRRVAEDREAKALISGPWPPYNFVASDLAPAGKSGLKSDR
ncbi:MAG: GvpL/GvpF family gas vesicle protein [Pseudomonadota bacterium]